ncbi:MAG TPA: hypothetical protein VGJ05_14500 [Fimbriiglobus sp.]|jgi:hypothetical protein
MAQETPVHSKLLTAAARSILRPMGLVQKGRSRTWLDDHQWWLCVVEFQPSAWSRGSYLNVGCMWLWLVKDYISFDVGYRVESFVDFRGEEQFEQAASQLANCAAQEVTRYRDLFPNIGKVCEYYLGQEVANGWPCYDAAIACALANKFDDSHAFFKRFAEPSDNNAFVANAQDDSRFLASLVGTHQFREVIADRVRQTRDTLKLPAVGRFSFD